MLVIHPLSRCDVCLDEYSFATPDQTPHAISCGHIFCNVCLQRCNPSQCPLCRKGFTRDRVKRLVVDRLPPNEAAEVPGTPGPPLPSQLEREEILLLQRLALVWRENAPQADVDSVITDVKRWLSENDGDRHRPLRNAVEAIRRYANLEEKLAIQISRYESKKSEYSHKSKNMEIIHKNFLEHVQNLESQHKTQLDDAQKQIAELKTQLEGYTHPPLSVRTGNNAPSTAYFTPAPLPNNALTVHPTHSNAHQPDPLAPHVFSSNPLPAPPRPFAYSSDWIRRYPDEAKLPAPVPAVAPAAVVTSNGSVTTTQPSSSRNMIESNSRDAGPFVEDGFESDGRHHEPHAHAHGPHPPPPPPENHHRDSRPVPNGVVVPGIATSWSGESGSAERHNPLAARARRMLRAQVERPAATVERPTGYTRQNTQPDHHATRPATTTTTVVNGHQNGSSDPANQQREPKIQAVVPGAPVDRRIVPLRGGEQRAREVREPAAVREPGPSHQSLAPAAAHNIEEWARRTQAEAEPVPTPPVAGPSQPRISPPRVSPPQQNPSNAQSQSSSSDGSMVLYAGPAAEDSLSSLDFGGRSSNTHRTEDDINTSRSREQRRRRRNSEMPASEFLRIPGAPRDDRSLAPSGSASNGAVMRLSAFSLVQPPATGPVANPRHVSSVLGVDAGGRATSTAPANGTGTRPIGFPPLLGTFGNRGEASENGRDTPSSVSSWGTVHTEDNVRNSRASLGDLGLGVFSNPGAEASQTDLANVGGGLGLIFGSMDMGDRRVETEPINRIMRESPEERQDEVDDADQFYTPRPFFHTPHPPQPTTMMTAHVSRPTMPISVSHTSSSGSDNVRGSGQHSVSSSLASGRNDTSNRPPHHRSISDQVVIHPTTQPVNPPTTQDTYHPAGRPRRYTTMAPPESFVPPPHSNNYVPVPTSGNAPHYPSAQPNSSRPVFPNGAGVPRAPPHGRPTTGTTAPIVAPTPVHGQNILDYWRSGSMR